jgi:hypothetical protein
MRALACASGSSGENHQASLDFFYYVPTKNRPTQLKQYKSATFFIFKKLLNCTLIGFSDFLSLGPFALDGVEVRRVWWQVKERLSFLFDGPFHLGSFKESCIVHQSHASRWEFGKKILLHPGREIFRMDVGLDYS